MEEAEGDGVVSACGLADGGEGFIEKIGEMIARGDDAEVAFGVVAEAGGHFARGEAAEGGGEMIDAGGGGEGVIDAGGEGADGDFDELEDGEADILCGGALVAQGEEGAEAVAGGFIELAGGPEASEGLAGDDKIAGATFDAEEEVAAGGEGHEAVGIDELEVTVAVSAEGGGVGFESGGEAGGLFGVAAADLLGEEAVDAVEEFAADTCEDFVGLDGDGDVVDEVDEDAEACEGEEDAERDGEVGDVGVFIGAADGAEDEEAVEEGGDKGAEDDLVGGIAHEIAEEARAELLGGEGEGDEGHGEDDAGDGHHGADNGGHDGAGAGGSAAVDEDEVFDVVLGDVAVDPEHAEGEGDGGEGHEGGEEPEAGAEAFPVFQDPDGQGRVLRRQGQREMTWDPTTTGDDRQGFRVVGGSAGAIAKKRGGI